jgi:hypothetical protein
MVSGAAGALREQIEFASARFAFAGFMDERRFKQTRRRQRARRRMIRGFGKILSQADIPACKDAAKCSERKASYPLAFEGLIHDANVRSASAA